MLTKLISIPIAIFVISSLAAGLGIPPAFACTCAAPGSPKDALKSYDAVFAGKIAEKISEPSGYLINFSASRSWKGIETNPTLVRTAKDSAACGYDFEPGKEYLVYARYNPTDSGETSLIANICSRTALLSLAGEDLKELGEGKPVVNQGPPDSKPIPPPENDNAALYIIAAIAAVGLIAGLVKVAKK